MPVTYRSVVPENSRDQYVEWNNVDFVMSFPNQKVALNTIRIEGVAKFYNADNVEITTEKVQMDRLAGAHSFFQNVSTFINGQSVDNIIEYPRMVKTMIAASENDNDMNNASNVCELKATNDMIAGQLLKREQIDVSTSGGTQSVPADFSIKPMIALNRNVSVNNNLLSYDQTGDIRVSVQLARNENVMYGVQCETGFNYILSELRLTYMTYPDDGEREKVVLMRTTSAQQSFAGQTAQLNMNSNILASSVFGSFILVSEQSQPAINNLKLAKPPVPNTVQFAWNNALNEYLTYELRSQTEMIDNFLDAVSFSGKNQASLNAIASNNGFGIGMRMGDDVDMMSNDLTVILNSSVADNEFYLLTMFFNGTEVF